MKPRVLVIEDNEQNLYLITFILEKAGYEVFQARSCSSGIDMAVANKPNLILMDIQLPEMDGYAVTRELRKIFSKDELPIIAVTSYAMAGDREKALEAGCNGYQTKPINPDTIIAYLEQFLIHKDGKTDG